MTMQITRRMGMAVFWVLAVVLIVGVPAHLFAQATATSSTTNFFGEGMYSLLAAFFVPRGLEWLKQRSWFHFMEDGARMLNRAAALVAAFLTALSIHYSFSHGADGWQLVIGGPHQSVIGFVGQFLAQFAGQETSYLWMKAAGAAAAVADILGNGRRP